MNALIGVISGDKYFIVIDRNGVLRTVTDVQEAKFGEVILSKDDVPLMSNVSIKAELMENTGNIVSINVKNEIDQIFEQLANNEDPTQLGDEFATAAGLFNGSSLTSMPIIMRDGAEIIAQTSFDTTGMEAQGISRTQSLQLLQLFINESPSVSLVNLVASIDENTSVDTSLRIADIVVTDDQIGVNELSLSGVDADQFIIVNNSDGSYELHLRAGTALDFETLSTFAVSVDVKDETLAEGVLDTDSMTLEVVDINDAPVSAYDLYNVYNEDSGIHTIHLLSDIIDAEGDNVTVDSASIKVIGDDRGMNILNGELIVQTNIYELSVTESTEVLYTYDVVDNHGGKVTKTSTVIINGVNDNPVATDDTKSNAINVGDISDISSGWHSIEDSDGLPQFTIEGRNSDGSMTNVAYFNESEGVEFALNANMVGISESVGGAANEIEYDRSYGASEQVVINLHAAAQQLMFRVSNLYADEGTQRSDEQGKWTAYLHGIEIASGTFQGTSNGDGLFSIDTNGLIFDEVRFEAMEYTGGATSGNNASDFFLDGFSASGNIKFVENEFNTTAENPDGNVDGGTHFIIAVDELLQNDSDIDSSQVGWFITVDGSRYGSGDNVIFDLPDGVNGHVSLSYTLHDGHGGSDSANVDAYINPAYIIPHGSNENDTIIGTDADDVIMGDIGGYAVSAAPTYNIALVIDLSRSMRLRIGRLEDALIHLVTQLSTHQGAINLAIIGFANESELVIQTSDLFGDLTILSDQIDVLSRSVAGKTNYQEAFDGARDWLTNTSNDYSSVASTESGAQNLTLLLTDGNPSDHSISAYTNLSAISRVRAIGIGDDVNVITLSQFDNTVEDTANSVSGVEIVQSAEDLTAALDVATFELIEGGGDFVDGGKGNDLIFGDSLYAVNLWGGMEHVPSAYEEYDSMELIRAFIADNNDGKDVSDTELHNFVTEHQSILAVTPDGDEPTGGLDVLAGGEGNDTIYGQFGDDELSGDKGDDILVGGLGADILTGGEGDDIFLWQKEDFDGQTDIIKDMDLTIGSNEKIDLSDIFQDSTLTVDEIVSQFIKVEDGKLEVTDHNNAANKIVIDLENIQLSDTIVTNDLLENHLLIKHD